MRRPWSIRRLTLHQDEVVAQNSHLQTPSASSSGRTPDRQTALQIPVIDCADVDPDNTSATTISPVFSAMRTYSASSCSTFPVHGRSSSRRLSHSSTCGAPFLLSPKALAETIASKSIAELEALGGLNGLAQGLQTDLYAGLCEDVSSSDAGRPSLEQGIHGPHQGRVEIYGVNKIPPKKTKGILELMMLALSDKVLVLLCIVAGISLFIGVYQALFQPHLPGQPRIEWVDSLTIMAAVLIVVVTGAVNDYQKEKQFARLVKKVRTSSLSLCASGCVSCPWPTAQRMARNNI